jgi:hypothetical protein
MANLVAENEIFFNSFEPKVSNRFIMYVDGLPSYIVRASDRPIFTQDPIALPHINVERYIKGRSKWNPINITLYDPISPSGAQAVMEWVRLHHESVTGRDGYADFYKKDIIFNTLGPVGDKVEEWILKGCHITAVNFGKMSWEDNNPLSIEMTIQPDYCILNF